MRYARVDKVDTYYGSPMGRREYNEIPGCECMGSILPLRMRDGYDNGGAYWGLPNNVWCATFCVSVDSVSGCAYGKVFVRAFSRAEAIKTVHKINGWENVRFRK